MTPLPDKPPGAYRVVHTADWHLGKMLGSLHRLEEQSRFLAWLEGVILSGQVDALIIAGDLFDSATPPQSAVRLYYEFLAGLHARSACAVVIISGNHDSPAQLEAPRDLLRVINAHLVASLPPPEDREAILIPLPSASAPRLLIAAMPYLRERDLRSGEAGESAEAIRAALARGIADRYREAAEAAAPWKAQGIPLLATGHLTALGSRGSESEREIHVGGLGAVGAEAFPESFSYVALGHLHRPQSVGGREQIRYSGSPIALSFSEADDAKEIRLLDFAGDHLAAQHALPIPQSRPLIRLRIARKELEQRLATEPEARGELGAWVEVTVTEADRSEDLFGTVRELTASWTGAEVIRVSVEHTTPLPRLEAAPALDAHALLDDPAAVFALRLDQEALEPHVREAVQTAFNELYSLLNDPS